MELKSILESLLFAAQKPLQPGEFRDILSRAAQSEAPPAQALKNITEQEISASLSRLQDEFNQAQHSFRLICVAGAWQFASHPDYAPWLKAFLGEKPRPPRLSQAALETLTIIAYRQPLTRAEIEQIRGVSVDGVMQTLIERGLVEQVGRSEVPGRPMTFGTTPQFLEYLGLPSLEDLPAADELRRIPSKPEPLEPAEPGLATVPPGELSQPQANAQNNPSAPPAREQPAPAPDSEPEPVPEAESEPASEHEPEHEPQPEPETEPEPESEPEPEAVSPSNEPPNAASDSPPTKHHSA